MRKSESLNELAGALAKAQSELRGALKDSVNPFFKSKYADLQSIWDTIRIPFSKNGLAVSQTTDQLENGQIAVVTTLMHSSGQWIEGVLPIMATKVDPQGIGSAISYSRRYALAAIAGVYQTDDDAEAAVERNDHSSPKQTKAAENTNVKATQSHIADNIQRVDLKDYIVPLGFLKGKKMVSCEVDALENTYKYFTDSSKPQSTVAKQMTENIRAFLDSKKTPLFKQDQDELDGIPF